MLTGLPERHLGWMRLPSASFDLALEKFTPLDLRMDWQWKDGQSRGKRVEFCVDIFC